MGHHAPLVLVWGSLDSTGPLRAGQVSSPQLGRCLWPRDPGASRLGLPWGAVSPLPAEGALQRFLSHQRGSVPKPRMLALRLTDPRRGPGLMCTRSRPGPLHLPRLLERSASKQVPTPGGRYFEAEIPLLGTSHEDTGQMCPLQCSLNPSKFGCSSSASGVWLGTREPATLGTVPLPPRARSGARVAAREVPWRGNAGRRSGGKAAGRPWACVSEPAAAREMGRGGRSRPRPACGRHPPGLERHFLCVPAALQLEHLLHLVP